MRNFTMEKNHGKSMGRKCEPSKMMDFTYFWGVDF
jgi:hypothetical protein